MDEHPELRGSDTQAEIKSLLNDAKRQLAAIKTGTGPL
jgi:hypothetical protein